VADALMVIDPRRHGFQLAGGCTERIILVLRHEVRLLSCRKCWRPSMTCGTAVNSRPKGRRCHVGDQCI
jgi:hypothetical protein